VGLLTTLRVREDRATLKDGKGGGPKGRLLDGFRLVARSRVLALFLLAMCIGRLGIALVEPQLAIFVREELGPLSLIVRESQEDAIDRTIALLSTVLAIGVLFTGATWSRLGDRLRPVRVLSAAGLVIGCSLLAMSLVETSAGLLSLRAVYAIGFAGLLPLSYAAISGSRLSSRSAPPTPSIRARCSSRSAWALRWAASWRATSRSAPCC
jgi:MFS family permease